MKLVVEFLYAMLINFSLSNFRSYRDTAEFSMIAGRVQSMRDSLFPVPGQRYMKLLPLSAIYGANASGKSNLVRALWLLQNIVLEGELYTEAFRLCPEYGKIPSNFDISFVSMGFVWNYSLSLTIQNVDQERLALVRGNKEDVLFERTQDGCVLGEFLLSKLYPEDRSFLQAVASKIQKNVLFLRHALTFDIKPVIELFRPTLFWFQNVLRVIFPEAKYAGITRDLSRYQDAYAHALANIGTGIKAIDKREVAIDQLNVPEKILDELKQEEEDVSFDISDSLSIVKENGELHAYRYRTQHIDSDGNPVYFPLNVESDGTRRLIHLLPTLIGNDEGTQVYVIDELDRSLHTALSRQLIEEQRCRAQRGVQQQMIFTTHDVMLMSQNLLRRDEMWATDKRGDEASHLISFQDFVDIRKDKDIRSSYLLGRMGGVPQICSLT